MFTSVAANSMTLASICCRDGGICPKGTLLEPQLPVRAQDDHVVDVERLESQDVAVDLHPRRWHLSERTVLQPEVPVQSLHEHGLRVESLERLHAAVYLLAARGERCRMG